jgi:hypothetical protein
MRRAIRMGACLRRIEDVPSRIVPGSGLRGVRGTTYERGDTDISKQMRDPVLR